MKKTMMYLPDDMHAYLAAEAGARGVSMAEIAREAIAEYRRRSESASRVEVARIVGIVAADGTVTDDASQVDTLLARYFEPGGAWETERTS